MQNNIHRQEENKIIIHTYNMAKITALLILILLVVVILNGYSAESAGRVNQLEKDDHVYESQKLISIEPGLGPDCSLLYNMCLNDPPNWCPIYRSLCPLAPKSSKDLQSTAAKNGNPAIEILP
jgi:hypothetical protein